MKPLIDQVYQKFTSLFVLYNLQYVLHWVGGLKALHWVYTLQTTRSTYKYQLG